MLRRQPTRLVRAIAIRNHLLPLIRERGEMQRRPFGASFISAIKWACRPAGETVPWDTQRTECDLFLFSLRIPMKSTADSDRNWPPIPNEAGR
jgi:hypothetical protein